MDGTSLNDAFRVLHARAIPTPETCRAAFHHDRTTAILSGLIVLGLVVSYCPQVSSSSAHWTVDRTR